ncbi:MULTISPECIES: response regulator transcription factor [unclassified Siphonobacter]|uniref:response regulator transcription factor n=1 Tax=unclassified Siphonobacter TaxID=2635712 RepID=UPI000CBADEF4|nr:MULTISPECIES: response regulator transcription factor [unclassified Siphonobacter]MDQ1090413.1 DNA-binding response OmpR family regulator [Siphonobacter sp. SORGH_AS_1065]MDR6197886.1 DNA-binding response OmpR family regulator [Siphonobacter sp. SORGH_AS_0500]PKK37206.1 DNA-binding response regulator [Siphonobacter sp. SORGH_AS_0500]
MKILLIDDEEKLVLHLQKGLRQAGYTVDIALSAATGLEMAAVGGYDLILLDLMLPGTTGFDVLRTLRAFGIEVPVMILSALNQSKHVVEGLDLGAVDYLRKPFELDELLARIRTVQRNHAGSRLPVWRVEDLTMDLASRQVSRAGQSIALTPREYQLLEQLMRQAGRVITKAQLTEKVWESDFDRGSNVVEVHVHQLRKKIDRGFSIPLLETVVGVGYRLRGKLETN